MNPATWEVESQIFPGKKRKAKNQNLTGLEAIIEVFWLLASN